MGYKVAEPAAYCAQFRDISLSLNCGSIREIISSLAILYPSFDVIWRQLCAATSEVSDESTPYHLAVLYHYTSQSAKPTFKDLRYAQPW